MSDANASSLNFGDDPLLELYRRAHPPAPLPAHLADTFAFGQRLAHAVIPVSAAKSVSYTRLALTTEARDREMIPRLLNRLELGLPAIVLELGATPSDIKPLVTYVFARLPLSEGERFRDAFPKIVADFSTENGLRWNAVTVQHLIRLVEAAAVAESVQDALQQADRLGARRLWLNEVKPLLKVIPTSLSALRDLRASATVSRSAGGFLEEIIRSAKYCFATYRYAFDLAPQGMS